MCLKQDGEVLVSEISTELLICISSHVGSRVYFPSDLHCLVGSIHLAESLSRLALCGLLLLGPKMIHKIIVIFES